MAGQTSTDRGRQARTKLLTAARELIGELGWSAVSTRILAERAGVRSGLVHYHFDSLGALLRQAAAEAMEELLDQSGAALEEMNDPAAAVETMLTELDRHTGDDPDSLLFIEAYLASTRDPELHEKIAAILARFRDRLAKALQRAGHRDPEGAAALIAAAFDGFVLHKNLDPDLTAARIAAQIRTITATQGREEEGQI